MKFAELFVGQSTTFTKTISTKDVESFARVSGDTNPIHLDQNYAKETIFKDRIVHGFLYGSFISRVLANDLPGPGTVYVNQELKFLKPVYHGDTVKVVVTVASKQEPNKATLTTQIFNQSGALVLDGLATVLVL